MGRIGPVLLRFRQSRACSEVKKRLLLHFAANSAIFAQANNGSIGFVGGAAGEGFTNIHGPTLSVSNSIENSKKCVETRFMTPF